MDATVDGLGESGLLRAPRAAVGARANESDRRGEPPRGEPELAKDAEVRCGVRAMRVAAGPARRRLPLWAVDGDAALSGRTAAERVLGPLAPATSHR